MKRTIADAQQAPQVIIQKIPRRYLEPTNADFWPTQIMIIAKPKPPPLALLQSTHPSMPGDADVPSGPSAPADQHTDRDEEEWGRIDRVIQQVRTVYTISASHLQSDPVVSLQLTLDSLQVTLANLWVDMLLGTPSHGEPCC